MLNEVHRESSPFYATVANLVAEFKCGRPSIDASRFDIPKTATNEETIEKLY